jgi:signal transduction histidine kinase
MRKLLSLGARIDCANLIRHFALCVAAGAALLYPGPLRVRNAFLGVVAGAACLNFLIAFVTDRAGHLRTARVLSAGSGILGWAALAWATGGRLSPFVAGFWLEIALSAVTFEGAGMLGVTAGCLASLWGLEALRGFSGPLQPLGLQEAFLLAMGLVMLLLSGRWRRSRSDWQRSQDALHRRLEALEREVGRVARTGPEGESTAQVAHSIKNAIHAMRGFLTLIQERMDEPDRHCRAMEGLQETIRRLEEVVRLTLAGPASWAGRGEAPGAAAVAPVIESVIAEVSACYPEIRWNRRLAESLPAIGVPDVVLHEALLNLIRNAAEAMDGRGEILVQGRTVGDRVEVEVRDQGKGITEADRLRLFRPGVSTKPGGSGLGLFLARRLVESQGGSLRAGPSLPEGGASFSIALPLPRV